MRIAEMLVAIAKWLESPENEALLLAEYKEDCLEKVANACVAASNVLKQCADEVDVIEGQRHLLINEAKQLLQALSATPMEKTALTVSVFDGEEEIGKLNATASDVLEVLKDIDLPEDITATVALAEMIDGETAEKVAKLANVFDGSADLTLQKQASVIDELLLSVSAPSDWIDNFKAAQAKKLDTLKQLYQEPNKKLHEVIGVEEAKKAIDKSEYNKEYDLPTTGLSTRLCPDHYTPVARIGQYQVQCPLDGKVYDLTTDFTDEQGRKHRASGDEPISMNTKLRAQYHSLFDTREDRINKLH